MRTRQPHLLLSTVASRAAVPALGMLTPLWFTATNLNVGGVLLTSWLRRQNAVFDDRPESDRVPVIPGDTLYRGRR